MNDATALAAELAVGRLSASACMHASLETAERLSHLGATIRIDPELGMANAQSADETPADARGPFHGIPFLGKDLGGYAKGLAPCVGSPALRSSTPDPDHDDNLFARFRACGLTPFGLTAVPEFGLALTSEPPGLPPARNPWNEALSPGGSSGGAAAAVAAGIVAIAHATDAAGSIRVPAACTGLVGLKPSRGAMPTGPQFANHLMDMASELVLARSVRDVETVFRSVSVSHVNTDRPIRTIGLALPDRCSDATKARCELAAKALEEAGYTLVSVDAPDALGLEAHTIIRQVFRAGLASWHDAVGLGPNDVTPIAFAIAEEGRSLTGAQIFDVSQAAVDLAYRTEHLFQDADVLLCPVLADGPPKIGAFDPHQTSPDERFDQMEAVAPNAALANVAGMPALALPFGMLEDTPFGVQLMGPVGCDAALLQMGAVMGQHAPTLTFPYPIAGLA